MNAINLNQTSINYPVNPPMFFVKELDLHYVVALDIPTIPSLSPEIFTSKGELTVESQSREYHEPQTILRLLPRGKSIKTIYEGGVLWLLLPKFIADSLPVQSAAV